MLIGLFLVGAYRYGFQGQEKDDEVKGEGNSINYKYRMHDPRIGRFFAVDPLAGKYPHYTPYSFSGNKVIHAVELEGLEEKVVIISDYYEGGKMVITRANSATNKEFVENRDRWSKAYINYDESWKENGNQEAFKMLYNGSEFKHNGTLTINLNSGSEGASYEPRPDNYFGSHYIGPNNPKNNFQKAYYNVYPQDVMDAAARVHDQDYDEVGAAGIWGVVSEETLEADIKLVRTSNKVLEMYNNGETDPFTGEKITSETADRAKAVVTMFSTVIIRKGLDHTSINLEKGQKLVDLLNDVEDIDINEATKRSDFD